MTVYAFDPARTTNAQAIVDCVTLGYLDAEVPTIDATANSGKFWNLWQPENLIMSDLDERFATDFHWDFLDLPLLDNSAPRIVFDPPYKYVGTSAHALDGNYGINEYLSVAQRDGLICGGAVECARVLARGGLLFVKVQDQVVSGQKHWQRRMVVDALTHLRLKDELHVSGYRAQPEGRRQLHSASNVSTLMVFEKGKS